MLHRQLCVGIALICLSCYYMFRCKNRICFWIKNIGAKMVFPKNIVEPWLLILPCRASENSFP